LGKFQTGWGSPTWLFKKSKCGLESVPGLAGKNYELMSEIQKREITIKECMRCPTLTLSIHITFSPI